MEKIYLKDYKKPDFEIEKTDLDFSLFEDKTIVVNTMIVKKINAFAKSLVLNGVHLELLGIELEGQTPKYESSGTHLTLNDVPEKFTLKIITQIYPDKNTELEGLYKSGGIFCTQCEPEGFRKITYFLDRPDVLSIFNVSIEADQKKYPVLLSNGNPVEHQVLANGRHRQSWKDPFKKPCYLFALVAGDLGVLEDTYKTMSGKTVQLKIYCPHGKEYLCHHALLSLKHAMTWDETRFGRECDLDDYMIVAIDDFNAGAMENKGLNIFNSKYVYADSKIATDYDYFLIESIIGHEYFHNWTGNRVTLRDWFHLSLKEGLTVFRDQEFSMDMVSHEQLRIENVVSFRGSQFIEDASPNAHPIRPESCYAVDNFFTPTIYEKGAEVIRMMQTMVGRPGFRKGMDLYFERHDGQAVIIEDFARAISDANNQNWDVFKLWYSQAGTPRVSVKTEFNEKDKALKIKLKQTCDLTATEKQEGLNKQPFHIPLLVGLIDKKGKELKIDSDQVIFNTEDQYLINFKKAEDEILIKNLSEKPYVSLNRQFSAPIYLDQEQCEAEMLFLMQNETDSFNQFEVAQKVYLNFLMKLVDEVKTGKSLSNPDREFLKVYENILVSNKLQPAFKKMLLALPSFESMMQRRGALEPEAFLKAYTHLKTYLAEAFQEQFLDLFNEAEANTHKSTGTAATRSADIQWRGLKNLCLNYLSELFDYYDFTYEQFKSSKNMTDQASALRSITESNSPHRAEALGAFYSQWKDEKTVVNKWLSLQATSYHPQTFKVVKELTHHEAFQIKNPNSVYALLRAFGNNMARFHQEDESCYAFMVDKIKEIDAFNPQVATRLAGSFDLIGYLPVANKRQIEILLRKLAQEKLSKNTFEIVDKILKSL